MGAPRRPRPSYVVIGTSAGGVTALSKLFKDIPEDFPGAILIVIHVHEQRSLLPLADVLKRAGRIPVKVAEDGEVIRQGAAYIAPASTHLLVEGDHLKLGTGPLEQRVRPAVDVLFRSAARVLGPRVIGVILTGMLRDGTAGLRAVHDAGGITVVQNPRDAEAPGMPASAMADLGVDYCLNLAEIAPALDLLVRRAGSLKKGVFETGLATALRLMEERTRLLKRLYTQSRGNPNTAQFLEAEITSLDRELQRLHGLVPLARSRRAARRARA